MTEIPTLSPIKEKDEDLNFPDFSELDLPIKADAVKTSPDSDMPPSAIIGEPSTLDYSSKHAEEKQQFVDAISSQYGEIVSYSTNQINQNMELVNSFWESKDCQSASQIISRFKLRTKMKLIGIRDTNGLIDKLAENPSIYSYYNLNQDVSSGWRVDAFRYNIISSEFITFLSSFGHSKILVDRLNKLKVNLSPFIPEELYDNLRPILTKLDEMDPQQFQKLLDDFQAYNWLPNFDLLESGFSLQEITLNSSLPALFEIIQQGGFTTEQRDLLNDYQKFIQINPELQKAVTLEKIVEKKEFLTNLIAYLSSCLLVNFTVSISDYHRALALEKKGALEPLINLLDSGFDIIGFTSQQHRDFDISLAAFNYSDEDSLDKSVRLVFSAVEQIKFSDLATKYDRKQIRFVEELVMLGEITDLLNATLLEYAQLNADEFDRLIFYLKSRDFSHIELYFPEISELVIKLKKIRDYDNLNEIINDFLPQPKNISENTAPRLLSRENTRRFNVSPDLLQVVRSELPQQRVDLNGLESDSHSEVKEGGLASIRSIRVDKQHIKWQTLDIINLQSEGKIRVQFVIDDSVLTNIRSSQWNLNNPNIYSTQLKYKEYTVVEAIGYSFEAGATILIPKSNEKAALNGLVTVEFDHVKPGDADRIASSIEQVINVLLSNDTTESLLTPPDENADLLLKVDLLDLQHDDPTKTDSIDISDLSTEVKKVLGDYQTVVIEGRSQRLKERFGSFVSYHAVGDYRLLPSLLTNGLLSSHERYRRGLIVEGMSTDLDFISGGANAVFVRTEQLEHYYSSDEPSEPNPFYTYTCALVFKPELWDRTDFYIYSDDQYGSVKPETFMNRLSPAEFLSRKKFNPKSVCSSNEQMFMRGISPEMIAGILVDSTDTKHTIIEALNSAGISEFNGVPLDDCISVNEVDTGYGGSILLDISEGKVLGSNHRARIESLRAGQNSVTSSAEVDETPPVPSLQESLLGSDLNMSQIIEMMSQDDEYIKTQFESSAHVSEGFTIGEHTMMVAGQYEKYFKDSHSTSLFSSREMMIGLALHDIGKHQAFEADQSTHHQHDHTAQLAYPILEKIGFSQERAALLLDIIAQDSIGKYLQYKNLETSKNEIVSVAKKHNVLVQEVFELMYVYYMADASSYTKDATGKTGFLDQIGLFSFENETLYLSEKNQALLQKLWDSISQDE